MRYLAHAVIHSGVVYRNSIVGIEDGRLTIERFDGEVHSTVFVSGIIVVAAESKMLLSDRQNLDRIVKRENLIELSIKKAMRYLERRKIFVTDDSDVPVFIIIER